MHRIDGGPVKKLAVAAFVVLLAACATTNKTEIQKAPVPKTFNLKLDVRLSGAANLHGDLTTCSGRGNFADIGPGTKVVVTNQNNVTLAVGAIAKGFGTNYYKNYLDECSFRIYVLGVRRAKRYSLIVGRQAPIVFTRAGLVRTNGAWSFDLNAPNVPNRIIQTTTTTNG